MLCTRPVSTHGLDCVARHSAACTPRTIHLTPIAGRQNRSSVRVHASWDQRAHHFVAPGLLAAALLLAPSPANADLVQMMQAAKPLPKQSIDKGKVWVYFIGGAVGLFLSTVAVENYEGWFPAISRANKAMSSSRQAAQQVATKPGAIDVKLTPEQQQQAWREQELLLQQQEAAAEAARQEAIVAAGLAEARARAAQQQQEQQQQPASSSGGSPGTAASTEPAATSARPASTAADPSPPAQPSAPGSTTTSSSSSTSAATPQPSNGTSNSSHTASGSSADKPEAATSTATTTTAAAASAGYAVVTGSEASAAAATPVSWDAATTTTSSSSSSRGAEPAPVPAERLAGMMEGQAALKEYRATQQAAVRD